MLHFSEKAKFKQLVITIIDHYGTEFTPEAAEKQSPDGYSLKLHQNYPLCTTVIYYHNDHYGSKCTD